MRLRGSFFFACGIAGMVMACAPFVFAAPDPAPPPPTPTPATPPKPTLSEEQKSWLKRIGVDPNVMKGEDLLKMLSGGCDSDPYVKLERYKSSANVQLTPKAASSDGSSFKQGIAPTLACRLVKFFEFANQKGCSIRITSAYRSYQQQANMCGSGRTGCAAPGVSCHQYGLAVDISSSCTGFLRQYLGTKNPNAPGARQFKLHFPYSGDHIQCLENFYASCSRATKPCDGKLGITPDSNFTPVGAPLGIGDQVRQALMPPQPPLSPQPQLPPQPLPQQASPFNAFGSSSPEIVGVSSQLGTPSTGNATSAVTKLEEIAFGTGSATSTSAATSVPLVVSADDAGGLSPDGKQHTGSSTSTSGGKPSQQTFISQDLSQIPVLNAKQTALQRLLLQLRATLQKLLAYLQPFGRPGPVEHTE